MNGNFLPILRSWGKCITRLVFCAGFIAATCPLSISQAQISEAQSYLLAHGNDEQTALFGGQWVGNGGDPLTLIFEQARRDSIDLLTQLDLSLTFPVSGNSAQHFLKQVRVSFLQSLRESPHHWVHVPKETGIKIQPTCARTNIDFPGVNPRSIWLASQLCRSVLGGLDAGELAMKLLLHETVHHFASDREWGFAALSESFADEVAEFLLLAWNYQRSLIGPSHQKVSVSHQDPRFGHSAIAKPVVHGSQDLIYVWGGCTSEDTFRENYCSQTIGSGFLIQAAAPGNDWLISPLSDEGAPSPRFHHAAFWAQVKDAAGQVREAMVIHGGCALETGGDNNSLCPLVLRDSFAYFPDTKSWLELRAEGDDIQPRSEFASVPFTNGLAIHGGLDGSNGSYRNDGYILEFVKGTLRISAIVPTGVAKESLGRKEHSLVWNGHELFVWGGCEKQVLGCRYVNHGFAYHPGERNWRSISGMGAPSPRRLHSAIRVGHLMLVWGGIHSSGHLLDGAVFDPESMTWQQIPKIPLAIDSPSERPFLAWDDSRSRLTVLMTGSSHLNSPSLPPQILQWNGLDRDQADWHFELLDFNPVSLQPAARPVYSQDTYYLIGGKWPPIDFTMQAVFLP